jgi:hypothetical protein
MNSVENAGATVEPCTLSMYQCEVRWECEINLLSWVCTKRRGYVYGKGDVMLFVTTSRKGESRMYDSVQQHLF